MKKILGISAIAVSSCILVGCSSSAKDETTTTTTTTTTYAVETTTAPTTTLAPETTTAVTTAAAQSSELGILSNVNITPVKNDTTGNWKKCSIVNKDIQIQDYALAYYKKYFNNDKEVHAIINFGNNTTTCIKKMGGLLFVDIYEYVNLEEYDANIMFSGKQLGEYIVYSNGEIEKN